MIDSHKIVWILEFWTLLVNFCTSFCTAVNWWSSFRHLFSRHTYSIMDLIDFIFPSVGFYIGKQKIFLGVSTSFIKFKNKLHTFRNQPMNDLKREQILQLVDVIGYSEKSSGCWVPSLFYAEIKLSRPNEWFKCATAKGYLTIEVLQV